MNTVQKFTATVAGTVFALAFVFAPALPTQAAHENTSQNAQISTLLSQVAEVLQNVQTRLDDADGGSMTPAEEAASPAADLRVTLNEQLKEHVTLGLDALHSVAAEHEDTNAAVEVLDGNTVELAATVGSVYGDEAEEEFLSQWREHIGFFADYATAQRENDEEMKEQAEEDLEGYAEDIAAFFAGALGGGDELEATITAGANEHQELLTASITAYEQGDYVEAYELEREAVKQAQGLADLLTEGIVTQNADQF